MKWLQVILFQNIVLLLVAAAILTGVAIEMGRPTPPAPVLRLQWDPATAEESHQWEVDNLGDTMDAAR